MMNYLVTNPFWPYCYGNERILERELPNLSDNDIEIMPMLLTPDVQDFDQETYDFYKENFEKKTIPYLKTLDIDLPVFPDKEKIGKSYNLFCIYEALKKEGLGYKFYSTAARKFFMNELNLNDSNELIKIATDLGANKNLVTSAIDNYDYIKILNEKLSIVDNTYHIQSVPSYVVNNQVYPGIQIGIQKIKEQM